MTQPPESSWPEDQPQQPPSGQPHEQPPHEQQQYGTRQYGEPGYGQPQYGAPPPPPPPGTLAAPGAPYGVHPVTGIPYSEKSKIVAGLLNILLAFPGGIGRLYIGDTNTGIAQLLVSVLTCGIGGLWSLIDGIIILTSDSKDPRGYMLRS